jgi:hypothetical protein
MAPAAAATIAYHRYRSVHRAMPFVPDASPLIPKPLPLIPNPAHTITVGFARRDRSGKSFCVRPMQTGSASWPSAV